MEMKNGLFRLKPTAEKNRGGAQYQNRLQFFQE